MTINVDNIGIPVPNGIESWANESEDNKTELLGMLESIVKLVYKGLTERVPKEPERESCPYDILYQKQLEEAKRLGVSKIELDNLINYVLTKPKETSDALKEIIKILTD